VTKEHPDKICDQISDAIVDHFLEQDPFARVRAECAISTKTLALPGPETEPPMAPLDSLPR
jgi:S-adenosylmethionine synthetase